LALTWWGFLQLPTGFIPDQDKGYLLASVQLPDASSTERTTDVIAKVERIALETPGVRHVNSVSGNSFLLSAYGSNFGSMFILLDDFSNRRSPELSGNAILERLRQRFAAEVPEAAVAVFGAPPVSGLGRAGGFRIMIEDRGDIGLEALQARTEELVRRGNEVRKEDGQPALTGLFSVFRANAPQLFVDVNRTECLAQGVELADVFATLQVYLGSRYVNDFNLFGRTWQVVVQADARFRDQVEDVKRLKVRNSSGGMVPVGTLASVREINGPLVLTRYN